MPVLYKNNASTKLAADVTVGDNSFSTISTPNFPQLAEGDWCWITIGDNTPVKVVDLTGLTFSLETAEGLPFNAEAGAFVELRMCEELIDDLVEDADIQAHMAAKYVPGTGERYTAAGGNPHEITSETLDLDGLKGSRSTDFARADTTTEELNKRVKKLGDIMGGTLNTKDLIPVTNLQSRLGSDTKRYSSLWVNYISALGNIAGNTGNFTDYVKATGHMTIVGKAGQNQGLFFDDSAQENCALYRDTSDNNYFGNFTIGKSAIFRSAGGMRINNEGLTGTDNFFKYPEAIVMTAVKNGGITLISQGGMICFSSHTNGHGWGISGKSFLPYYNNAGVIGGENHVLANIHSLSLRSYFAGTSRIDEQPISDSSFVYNIVPTTYKMADEEADGVEVRHFGFDIGSYLSNVNRIVTESNPVSIGREGADPDSYSTSATDMIPHLVKCIQEQKKEIDNLKNRLSAAGL